MRYKLLLTTEAERDLEIWASSGQKKILTKIYTLFEELAVHPATGTGHPERLRHLPGVWSRRIDKKSRLVYSIHDDVVEVHVISLLGHYDDK